MWFSEILLGSVQPPIPLLQDATLRRAHTHLFKIKSLGVECFFCLVDVFPEECFTLLLLLNLNFSSFFLLSFFSSLQTFNPLLSPPRPSLDFYFGFKSGE